MKLIVYTLLCFFPSISLVIAKPAVNKTDISIEVIKKVLDGISNEKKHEFEEMFGNLTEKILNMTRLSDTLHKKLSNPKSFNSFKFTMSPKLKPRIMDIPHINDEANVLPFLYDGDMNLSKKQTVWLTEAIEYEKNRKRTRIPHKRDVFPIFNTWEHNTVYYYFATNFSNEEILKIESVLKMIEENTCVQFVKDKWAAHKIKIVKGAGCSSEVGLIKEKAEQILSLGENCLSLGTIMHEFMHALGFYHSHNAPYRSIQFNNGDRGNKYYVNRMPPRDAYLNSRNVPYDYASILHYKQMGLESLYGVHVDADRYQHTIGTRIWPTFYDFDMINHYYSCEDKCKHEEKPIWCENGGEVNPNNCQTCICPSGYAGKTCTERPRGCGNKLKALSVWQTITYHVTGNDDAHHSTLDDIGFCHHWISAPERMQVEVRLKRIDWKGNNAGHIDHCEYGCNLVGVEVKTNAEKRNQNPRVCCPSSMNRTFISSLNPAPIISYSVDGEATVELEYRYRNFLTKPDRGQSVRTEPCEDVYGRCPEMAAKEGYCTAPDRSNEEIKASCGFSCGMCHHEH